MYILLIANAVMMNKKFSCTDIKEKKSKNGN